jgi:prepilin-type N-terminal cleavage/methylation domain-containing protein
VEHLAKKTYRSKGFTLIELIITVAMSVIVMLGVGIALVDSHRGWQRTYDRSYSDVITDGYVARKMFDATVREASSEMCLLDVAGRWIEVYLYANDSSTDVDRYARFYYQPAGENEARGYLNLQYGNWNPNSSYPRDVVSTQRVCSNVVSCVFRKAGYSISMILTLDNGSQNVIVTSSSVMHSQ